MSGNNVDKQDHLNRMAPAAHDVGLGDLLQEIIDNQNALLAKLDATFTAQNAAVAASQLDVDFAETLALTDINAR